MYKPGFSVENKNEIRGESGKNLIEEMYGKPKSVFLNSDKPHSTKAHTNTERWFFFLNKNLGENFDENF